MRIFCNGFNLYGQLDDSEHLLEVLTAVFRDKDVKDIFISHSFTVLQINNNFELFFENEQKTIDSCGKILKLASNNERIVVLNDEGKLYKLELTNFDLVREVPNILNSEIPDEKIVNMGCGSKLCIAYSNRGKLFNIPHKLNFENVNIIDIICGNEHCILLDKFGNVYTFGRGSRGQLGHGRLDDESEPLQVEALGGIKIVQIAAGGWHSCAVSKDGDLYTWGWNGNGQLGLLSGGRDEGDCVSVMALPHIIDISDSQRNVMKVACGNRHTIILLDNNHLLGCGWNKYKQVLNDAKESLYAFTYLHDYSNQKVVDIKCGPWNSVVLCK